MWLLLWLLATPHAFATDYVTPGDYSRLERGLHAPKKDSAEDHNDIQDVLEHQRKRTPEDCARALREQTINPESFWGSSIPEAKLKVLAGFLADIGRAVNLPVSDLKHAERRTRPINRKQGVVSCNGQSSMEDDGTSFPSGHAAIAYIQAFALSDLFPDQRRELIKRADQIGDDRVYLGIHHKNDVKAGFEIARRTYELLKTRKTFLRDLEAQRAKLGGNAAVPPDFAKPAGP